METTEKRPLAGGAQCCCVEVRRCCGGCGVRVGRRERPPPWKRSSEGAVCLQRLSRGPSPTASVSAIEAAVCLARKVHTSHGTARHGVKHGAAP